MHTGERVVVSGVQNWRDAPGVQEDVRVRWLGRGRRCWLIAFLRWGVHAGVGRPRPGCAGLGWVTGGRGGGSSCASGKSFIGRGEVLHTADGHLPRSRASQETIWVRVEPAQRQHWVMRALRALGAVAEDVICLVVPHHDQAVHGAHEHEVWVSRVVLMLPHSQSIKQRCVLPLV